MWGVDVFDAPPFQSDFVRLRELRQGLLCKRACSQSLSCPLEERLGSTAKDPLH